MSTENGVRIGHPVRHYKTRDLYVPFAVGSLHSPAMPPPETIWTGDQKPEPLMRIVHYVRLKDDRLFMRPLGEWLQPATEPGSATNVGRPLTVVRYQPVEVIAVEEGVLTIPVEFALSPLAAEVTRRHAIEVDRLEGEIVAVVRSHEGTRAIAAQYLERARKIEHDFVAAMKIAYELTPDCQTAVEAITELVRLVRLARWQGACDSAELRGVLDQVRGVFPLVVAQAEADVAARNTTEAK